MKTLKKILLSALLISASAASYAEEPALRLVQADIKARALYVPEGFDSNDEVVVVVTGYLPSLCYRSPRAKCERQGTTFVIGVQASVMNYPTFCALVVMPFQLTVSLGNLPPGEYKIETKDMPTPQTLNVAAALTPNVDDHIYAQVRHVDTTPPGNKIILHAYIPSECLKYDRVKYVPNPSGTVLSILPIMKKVSDFCPMKMTPIKIELELPAQYVRDNVLLHVRSMDGQSANAILNFTP